MIVKPKFECKSTITETTKVLDISSIDWSKYPNPKRLESNIFPVDDLKMRFHIYPNGFASDPRIPPGRCVIGLRIVSHQNVNLKNDLRKLLISISCDSYASGIGVYNVCQCYSKSSTVDYFPTEILTSSSKLSFTIKLHHDPSFVYKTPSISFEKQLAEMYRFSKSLGDITLIVMINENDNESYDNDLYIPPNKKQKRNNNNNSDNDLSEKKQKIHRIKACSITLKSISKVFERMLDPKNNMMEFQNKEIIIHAESVEDVDDLLRFMSVNALRTDCNAFNLIKFASLYDMGRLFWECVNRLIGHISIDNFVKTIETFDRYEITEGYDTLIKFAKHNMDKLEKRSDFLTLSHSFRCGILLQRNKK